MPYSINHIPCTLHHIPHTIYNVACTKDHMPYMLYSICTHLVSPSPSLRLPVTLYLTPFFSSSRSLPLSLSLALSLSHTHTLSLSLCFAPALAHTLSTRTSAARLGSPTASIGTDTITMLHTKTQERSVRNTGKIRRGPLPRLAPIPSPCCAHTHTQERSVRNDQSKAQIRFVGMLTPRLTRQQQWVPSVSKTKGDLSLK